MIDDPAQRAARGGGGVAGILREALVVAAIGVAIGFLANYSSPRGLELTRHYSVDAGAPASAATSPAPSLEERLKALGIRLIRRAEAEQLFHDPRLQQHEILFIDARDEEDYRKGHIPGASEFYPYYPEKYLPEVRPLCDFAGQIVVYCAGGECEDSQNAAIYLRDTGVPPEKLLVFAGGITEWEAAGLPVESGDRDSGEIHEGGK